MLELRQMAAARRAAEYLMSTTVQIGNLVEGTDPETFDPITVIEPVWAGKARIHTRQVASTTEAAPGTVFTLQSLVLSVPVEGTGDITTGMSVKVVTNTHDTSLEGVTYTVKGTSAESQQVARRFEIERIS